MSRISEDAKGSWAVARLGCQGVLGVAVMGWVSAVWPVCMSGVRRARVLWSLSTQEKHTHTYTYTHTHTHTHMHSCSTVFIFTEDLYSGCQPEM